MNVNWVEERKYYVRICKSVEDVAVAVGLKGSYIA